MKKTIWKIFITSVALGLAMRPSFAGQNPANMPSVPNIAALVALGSSSSQYVAVNVQGYGSSSGSGGGVFFWKPASVLAPDSCIVFQATGVTTGRWIRQSTGVALSPDDCGAIQGAASDSAITAWVAALNAYQMAGVIHKGTWIFSTPQTFTFGAHITCDDTVNSVIDFEPTTSPATAFTWSKGADSVNYMYWSGCQGSSSKTTTKTMFNVSDVRGGEISFFTMVSGNWPGTDSIFLQTNGRDDMSIHDLAILTARPFVFGVNPNDSILNVDHFHLWNIEAGSTRLSGGKTYEFLDGVNISQFTFDGYQACEIGDYCVYWNDTSSSIASTGLSIKNMRTEQGVAPSAYSFDLESTAQDLQSFSCDNCVLDSARNGIKTNRVLSIGLSNGQYSGTGIGLNITGKAGTVVNLDNFFQQSGSTDSLTNLLWLNGNIPQINGSPTGENTTWAYQNSATGGHTLPVAQLPGCTGAQSQRFVVSDSNATTFNAIVAGGGSNIIGVICDGTNWRIGG